MALYLARDDGSGSILPDEGFTDVIQIANFDTGIGETDDPTDTKGIILTYARTDGGIPPVRLDDLVNEVSYSGVDIVIFPVVGSFALADGTLITTGAGFAVPVGNANNPTASDIVTFYDTSECNGSGYFVDKEGGGSTGFPRPVLLYHELAHCLHFATGVPTTEPLAEADENDMRDQLGIDHRDASSHNGGCGGGPTSCCLVASVASGSPFSTGVNRLRRVRDHFLRASRVGADFFERLHYDYYAFSPQVCDFMGRSEQVHELVRDRFVYPLILGLELVMVRSDNPHDPAALGRTLAAQLDDPMVQPLLGLVGHSSSPLPVGLDAAAGSKLADLLASTALRSPYVSWGLVEVLTMWDTAAGALRSGDDAPSVGRDLGLAIDAWATRFPVSPLWGQLEPHLAGPELDVLGDLLLPTASQRRAFGKRLAGAYPELRPTVGEWLAGERASTGAPSKEVA